MPALCLFLMFNSQKLLHFDTTLTYVGDSVPHWTPDRNQRQSFQSGYVFASFSFLSWLSYLISHPPIPSQYPITLYQLPFFCLLSSVHLLGSKIIFTQVHSMYILGERYPSTKESYSTYSSHKIKNMKTSNIYKHKAKLKQWVVFVSFRATQAIVCVEY